MKFLRSIYGSALVLCIFFSAAIYFEASILADSFFGNHGPNFELRQTALESVLGYSLVDDFDAATPDRDDLLGPIRIRIEDWNGLGVRPGFPRSFGTDYLRVDLVVPKEQIALPVSYNERCGTELGLLPSGELYNFGETRFETFRQYWPMVDLRGKCNLLLSAVGENNVEEIRARSQLLRSEISFLVPNLTRVQYVEIQHDALVPAESETIEFDDGTTEDITYFIRGELEEALRRASDECFPNFCAIELTAPLFVINSVGSLQPNMQLAVEPPEASSIFRVLATLEGLVPGNSLWLVLDFNAISRGTLGQTRDAEFVFNTLSKLRFIGPSTIFPREGTLKKADFRNTLALNALWNTKFELTNKVAVPIVTALLFLTLLLLLDVVWSLLAVGFRRESSK